MKTVASILIDGIKQRFYFSNVVFLQDNTEFEIEIFNKSEITVCPSISINGEALTSSPVVYNGQKYVLKDFIDDSRRFRFAVYSVDGSDQDALNAIRKNGLIELTYYYESKLKKKPLYNKGSNIAFSIPDSVLDFGETDLNFTNNEDIPTTENRLEDKSKVETGKITKGSDSRVRYNTVNVDLDYSYSEKQVIRLLPLTRKPSKITCELCKHESSGEANFCEMCGHQYLLKV